MGQVKPTLEDLLDLDIDGWRPKPGDKVLGTVVNVGVGGEGSTFGAYPLYLILGDDGEPVAVHAFHQVLKNQLKAAKVGDRVGIRYKGKTEAGGYGGYEDYRVVIAPPDDSGSQ